MASRSNKTVRYAQPAMTSAPKMAQASMMTSIRGAVASRKPQPSFQRIVKTMPYRTGSPPNNPTDASGNRLGGRRQVGEASSATRRAALDAALKPGPAVKPAPITPQPAATYDGGGIGNKKRRKVIDDNVDLMSR